MTKKILFSFILIMICGFIHAQDTIRKEVQVVKEYEPRISDPYKINELPDLQDTLTEVPDFSYQTRPFPFETQFRVEPIKAARMVGEPLQKLYGKHVKLGFGNYWSPLVYIGAHNLRSEENSYGAHFSHYSSHGNVNLTPDKEVYAGTGDNELSIYGKKFYEDLFVAGDISLNSQARHFYGYGDQVLDTINLDKRPVKQRYTQLSFDSRVKSTYDDSAHIKYDFRFGYYYLRDQHNNYENQIRFSSSNEKIFQAENIGLDAELEFYDRSKPMDTTNQLIMGVTPWLGKFGDRWQVKAGINIMGDLRGDNQKIYYYPVASLEYNIVNNVLVPYAGIDGKLIRNTYNSIRQVNPFIQPGLNVADTDQKFRLYGGIRGHFSSRTSFNFRASYQVCDNMYFFVNENTPMANRFTVLYDYTELTRFFGELGFNINDRLFFHIKGNYYSYKLQTLDHPWHKPDFDLSFSGRYNIQDKIILSTDIYAIGTRYVENRSQADAYLDGSIEADFEIKYFFSKILNGFVRFNNITGTDHQLWKNYPVQGFTVIAGAGYSF